jgi:hypothetical protein
MLRNGRLLRPRGFSSPQVITLGAVNRPQGKNPKRRPWEELALLRSPWQLVVPGHWQLDSKGKGWHYRRPRLPRARFHGLEVAGVKQPNELLDSLRFYRKLRENIRRKEQSRRHREPVFEPQLSSRSLGRGHFLRPGQRWLQRSSFRSLRHPSQQPPMISVPMDQTVRYRRARKRLYQYMLLRREMTGDYSQARVAMRDFVNKVGPNDPASFP